MSMRARVLVVEDIAINRDLVVQLLEDNYDMLVAVDGEEAIRVAEEQRPDLILMDLSLPGIDGLEATRRIKGQPVTAAIPILALTARAMAGDRERALSAGCDDYLTKPIDDVLLERKLREWLEATASRRAQA